VVALAVVLLRLELAEPVLLPLLDVVVLGLAPPVPPLPPDELELHASQNAMTPRLAVKKYTMRKRIFILVSISCPSHRD
jgi:hypothetical protein